MFTAKRTNFAHYRIPLSPSPSSATFHKLYLSVLNISTQRFGSSAPSGKYSLIPSYTISFLVAGSVTISISPVSIMLYIGSIPLLKHTPARLHSRALLAALLSSPSQKASHSIPPDFDGDFVEPIGYPSESRKISTQWGHMPVALHSVCIVSRSMISPAFATKFCFMSKNAFS